MSRRGARTLKGLNREIVGCDRCPRLRTWCESVAKNPRASYRGERYWGKPVPSFGDDAPQIIIVGLAPGAHGANRTGRMFTGDSSGDWLFEALHSAKLCAHPRSVSRRDGQELYGVRITGVVHCAPPGNKPSREERDACRPFLSRELSLCGSQLRVIVALGGFAWDGALWALGEHGYARKPKPKFGHGVEVGMGPYHLMGCFHPSQLNTFTGRLTRDMLRDVFVRARDLSRG
ncbi:MAG: uracil-DNA glycosylase [Nannocystaceae bacterium]